jgi:hypothetical protein
MAWYLVQQDNLLTYTLTPWCRILFEKLIVTQPVKKYPAFLWNPKIHYRIHTSPPLDPILSQLNPVRPIDLYPPEVHLNVILPPKQKDSFTFNCSLYQQERWKKFRKLSSLVITSNRHSCHGIGMNLMEQSYTDTLPYR